MATTAGFLPGESQGQRSLVGLQSMGSQSQTQLSDLARLHGPRVEGEICLRSQV